MKVTSFWLVFLQLSIFRRLAIRFLRRLSVFVVDILSPPPLLAMVVQSFWSKKKKDSLHSDLRQPIPPHPTPSHLFGLLSDFRISTTRSIPLLSLSTFYYDCESNISSSGVTF